VRAGCCGRVGAAQQPLTHVVPGALQGLSLVEVGGLVGQEGPVVVVARAGVAAVLDAMRCWCHAAGLQLNKAQAVAEVELEGLQVPSLQSVTITELQQGACMVMSASLVRHGCRNSRRAAAWPQGKLHHRLPLYDCCVEAYRSLPLTCRGSSLLSPLLRADCSSRG
jgi:hypothetical protein